MAGGEHNGQNIVIKTTKMGINVQDEDSANNAKNCFYIVIIWWLEAYDVSTGFLFLLNDNVNFAYKHLVYFILAPLNNIFESYGIDSVW